MEPTRPTYAFENGKAYAFVAGKVIASADSIEELRKIAAEPKAVVNTGHITTPAGLKGRVLGSTTDLWDREEVTVRMENGHIAHLRVGEFAHIAPEVVATSQVEDLRSRLAATIEADADALRARIGELRAIRAEATAAVTGATDGDAAAFDAIVVAAEHDIREATDIIAQLEDDSYEGFIPLAPFASHVVEQESLGTTANWLDAVSEDMVREADATNFQTLLDEGPEAFLADLDDAPLADAGITRQMAASLVRTKTAGVQDAAIRDRYERMFLARVEEVRRDELANRRVQTHKQAAATHDEHDSLPDEAFFI